MTVTAALWTQTGSFTAQEDRALISALLGARHFVDLAPGISKVDAGGGHGVIGSSDLAVTPGAGHSVNVAAGQAFVRGTQTAGQGVYLLGNDATVSLLVATPDATNPRIDLVQLRVTDDSGGAGVGTLDVKTGVPAGSPSPPTPDENALVLATVLVPASAASSENYTITDRRTRATALGGVHPCTSTTRPNPASTGQIIHELDTGLLLRWTGTAWRYLPGQILAKAEITTTHNAVAVDTDFPGASVTFDSLGGQVEVTAQLPLQNTGSQNSILYDLLEGASTVIAAPLHQALYPTTGLSVLPAKTFLTPAAGTRTWKLRHRGLNAVNLVGTPTRKGLLVVQSA